MKIGLKENFPFLNFFVMNKRPYQSLFVNLQIDTKDRLRTPSMHSMRNLFMMLFDVVWPVSALFVRLSSYANISEDLYNCGDHSE